jgi:hypothetical protein
VNPIADPSHRRFIAMLVGVLVMALNNRLGLNLDTGAQAALVGLIVAYIGQSVANDMKKAQLAANTAGAAVTSPQAALDAMNAKPPAAGGFASLRMLLVLFLAVAVPVFAQTASSDAPVRTVILKGAPAPADGCYLNNVACVDTGKELASLRAERDSLKQSMEDSPPPSLYVAGGAILGLLVGVLMGPPALKLIRGQ